MLTLPSLPSPLVLLGMLLLLLLVLLSYARDVLRAIRRLKD